MLGGRQMEKDVPFDAEERRADEDRVARAWVCDSPDGDGSNECVEHDENDGGSKVERIRDPAYRGGERLRRIGRHVLVNSWQGEGTRRGINAPRETCENLMRVGLG